MTLICTHAPEDMLTREMPPETEGWLASSSTFQITCPLCSMPVSSQGTCVRCAENSFFPDGACQSQSGKDCKGVTCHMGFPSLLTPCTVPLLVVTLTLVVDRVPGVSSGGSCAYLTLSRL